MRAGARKAAKLAGLSRYQTGVACGRGHVCDRITLTGQCIECRRELERARYSADHDGSLARAAVKYRRNSDKIRERRRADHHERQVSDPSYRADAVVRARLWCEANPERAKVARRNTKARRKMAEGAHTAADVAAIMKAQRGKCAYCRRKLGVAYHVDHVMPLARRGGNGRENLQILCAPCNLTKAAKHPAEFARSLGLLI